MIRIMIATTSKSEYQLISLCYMIMNTHKVSLTAPPKLPTMVLHTRTSTWSRPWRIQGIHDSSTLPRDSCAVPMAIGSYIIGVCWFPLVVHIENVRRVARPWDETKNRLLNLPKQAIKSWTHVEKCGEISLL
jgi:hypothetical protein